MVPFFPPYNNVKASIDASPTSAWLLHGLLITSDSGCHLSVMFSASFIFPFPNTDETVSKPDHAWTKSKCCLMVSLFELASLILQALFHLERSKRQACCFANGEQASMRYLCHQPQR